MEVAKVLGQGKMLTISAMLDEITPDAERGERSGEMSNYGCYCSPHDAYVTGSDKNIVYFNNKFCGCKLDFHSSIIAFNSKNNPYKAQPEAWVGSGKPVDEIDTLCRGLFWGLKCLNWEYDGKCSSNTPYKWSSDDYGNLKCCKLDYKVE